MTNSLLRNWTTNKVSTDISAGIIVGINIVISCLSYAGLVLSGYLQPYLLQGFVVFLLSTLLTSFGLLLLSKEPLSFSVPSHQTVAILAVLSSSITASLFPHVSLEVLLPTVYFVIAATTISTGIIFFILGYFRLGNLIRYIPYPVTNGFLAGTGWIILKGSLNVLLGIPITTGLLPTLWHPDVIFTLVLLLGWSVMFYFLVRRYQTPAIFPLGLILSTIGFYIVLSLMHISQSEAIQRGWMLPHAMKLHAFDWIKSSVSALWQHQNGVIFFNESWNIIAAVFISCISLFFNIIGLEFILDKEIDSNKELRIAGLLNIIIGCLGGVISYLSLTNTFIAKKASGKTKLVALTCIIVLLLVFAFGLPLVAFLPRVILSGMLMYYGLSLLLDVLFDNWLRVSLIDYLLTIFIVLGIIILGLLPGLFLGILLATILFVVHYSQVSVVRYALRGTALHSNTQRPNEINAILDAEREKIVFFKVGGYIFFGTANNLLDQIKAYYNQPQAVKPEYFILDFSRVNDVDSSAMMVFARMNQFSIQYQTIILITSLPKRVAKQFATWKIITPDSLQIRYFANNDLALEWCENELLRRDKIELGMPAPFSTQLEKMLPALSSEEREKFVSYLERREIKISDYVFRQGEVADSLYFVQSGEVAITLELRSGEVEQLRKIGSSNIVGEIGLYNQRTRVTSAIATKVCVLYRLSNESLTKMREQDNKLASALDWLVIKILSERLEYLDKQIKLLI